MKKEKFRRVEQNRKIILVKGSQFTEKDKIKIGKTFLRLIEDFYSDPKNEKEFWELGVL